MPSVFHYSTNGGALGIIGSQCLWATHYRYLNDFRELQMLNDIMIPILEEDFRSEAESMIAQGRLSPEVLKEYGESVYRIEAENLMDKAFSASEKLSPMFVTSFCEHKEGSEHWENGLLSQWRAYGSDGGCAIEFDEIELNTKLADEGASYKYASVLYNQVKYDDYEKHFDGSRLAGLAAKVLRRLEARTADSIAADFGDLYEAIARWAPIFKSSSFREEAESRIVVARTRGTAAKADSRENVRPIRLRYKSGTPVPYIELFAESGKLPIKRIIVGPQKDQDKVSYALELMLEQAEIDAKIDVSDISYLP